VFQACLDREIQSGSIGAVRSPDDFSKYFEHLVASALQLEQLPVNPDEKIA
jgi:hypothetical protein